MLRLLLLLLLAANGLYFAWTQGSLQRLGLAPTVEAEPQRLAQQIRPDALRVVAPAAANPAPSAATGAAGATEATLSTAPPAPGDANPGGECLQTALLDMPQAATARERAAAVLPAGGWTMEPATVPARWIVYMGRYTDAAQVERKRAELRARGVAFEPLVNAALEPGLSLGAHTSREAAATTLAALVRQGVKTARLVEERPEQQGQVLRVRAAPEDARAFAAQLAPALGELPLRPCP